MCIEIGRFSSCKHLQVTPTSCPCLHCPILNGSIQQCNICPGCLTQHEALTSIHEENRVLEEYGGIVPPWEFERIDSDPYDIIVERDKKTRDLLWKAMKAKELGKGRLRLGKFWNLRKIRGEYLVEWWEEEMEWRMEDEEEEAMEAMEVDEDSTVRDTAGTEESDSEREVREERQNEEERRKMKEDRRKEKLAKYDSLPVGAGFKNGAMRRVYHR